MWVSPFRDLRIKGYVRLPAAYRSLSRLSSALSAKASALCPFCLTFPCHPSVDGNGLLILSFRCLLYLNDGSLNLKVFHVCSFQGAGGFFRSQLFQMESDHLLQASPGALPLSYRTYLYEHPFG